MNNVNLYIVIGSVEDENAKMLSEIGETIFGLSSYKNKYNINA